MRPLALCAAMFVTVLVGARDARAEQTVETCKEGFARAQHRETDGMFSAARDAYAGCAVAECPDGVRDDCAAALERLDKDKHEEEESGRAIVGPLIVGGVGTVALIVAAVLHSNASASTAEADAVSQPAGLDMVVAGGDNTQQLYEEDRLRRRADRYETAAIIVLGGGLLAIAGAVVWHFASGSAKPAKASSSSVSFRSFSPVIRF